MALDISLHRVASVGFGETKFYASNGMCFWSRDIKVTFADGMIQCIGLFSDVSAEALALESENSAMVPAA